MTKEILDLDEIERELKEISSWPWKCGLPVGATTYIGTGTNIIDGYNFGVRNLDANFIAKSPQRLAAAVKRIRFLEDKLNKYQLRIEKAAISPPDALNKSADYLDGWVEGLESIMDPLSLKSSNEQEDRTDLSKFIGLDGEITPDGFKIRNKKSSDK